MRTVWGNKKQTVYALLKIYEINIGIRIFENVSNILIPFQWAFGVLLWELTTLAQQPYVEVDAFEMASYLRDGYRLAQPINCPDELFAVMAYCWAMSADERPTFSQLIVCLQDFHTQLTRYVWATKDRPGLVRKCRIFASKEPRKRFSATDETILLEAPVYN